MNKVIIIGHPESGYSVVENLLCEYGMSEAKSAYTEEIYPRDVDSMLCKAHGIPALSDSSKDSSIRQIDVSKVWNGLALDLMRGNLEQQFWGWSDPQAVYLLDYWHELDNSIFFILVYNHPRTALSMHRDTDDVNASHAHEIAQWQAYNEALLQFFHRHQDRCLLVHADQVKDSATTYLQQLNSRLTAPLTFSEHEELVDSWAEDLSESESAIGQESAPSDETSLSCVQNNLPEIASQQDLLQHKQTPLGAYLATEVLELYPEALELYEELQAVANLSRYQRPAQQLSPLHAWRVYKDLLQHSLKLNQASFEARIQVQEIQLEKNALAQEHQQLCGDLSLKEQQLADNRKRIEQLEKEKQDNNAELSQENELLLQQLHQVQEGLEKQYLDGQQKLQELEKYKNSNQEYQSKNQDLQSDLDRLKARIEDKTRELQEVERQALKDTTELNEENHKFKSENDSLKKHLTQQNQKNDTRVQEFKQENELILQQLHQVQEELERYYLQNQELKAQLHPVYYGAAERLQSELPYTLGGAIIQRTRKLWPLPFLPLSMWRVKRRWKKEHKQDFFSEELPPLEEYSDYEKAQKAQQHLSYRLGVAWMKHIRTPWGWIIMPFALLGAHRRFRKYRRAQGK
jgi:hypothetical protein